MLVLAPPVPGPIVRPFHYAGSPFARGLHRGVDLQAPAGTPVAAPCTGRVAYAGPAAVTLLCDHRRVTLLPLADVVLDGGARIRSGDRVARVRGREGLHLGVRHPADPFGYVDPAPLLRRSRPAPPPLAGPRARPPSARPWPARPRPPRAPLGSADPLAPWPAWAGLGAILAGLRVRVRARRRPARTRAAPARDGPARAPHVS